MQSLLKLPVHEGNRAERAEVRAKRAEAGVHELERVVKLRNKALFHLFSLVFTHFFALFSKYELQNCLQTTKKIQKNSNYS